MKKVIALGVLGFVGYKLLLSNKTQDSVKEDVEKKVDTVKKAYFTYKPQGNYYSRFYN